MAQIRQAARDHELRRWMRPDWRRYWKPGHENDPLYKEFERIERKFSPDQPRVPAGNREGGQWTDEGGSGGGGGGRSSPQEEPTASSGRSDPRVLSDATPDNYYKPGTQLAQNESRPASIVDLRSEDARGGHTIANHVGKSESYLLSVVQEQALSTTRRGEFADGLREGSFTSLEAANKLVSSTLAQNPDKVAAVAAGMSPREQAEAVFNTPTGIEAYAATERSGAYIRATNGVRVVIVPDTGVGKGYRVDTAFPTSIRR